MLDDVALFPIVAKKCVVVVEGDSEENVIGEEALVVVVVVVGEIGAVDGNDCCWREEGEVVEGELGERSDDEVNNRREEESVLGSFESSVYRFIGVLGRLWRKVYVRCGDLAFRRVRYEAGGRLSALRTATTRNIILLLYYSNKHILL